MINLEKIGPIPLDFATISRMIGEYKSPRDKISKMEKAGELIRLKKGMFAVSPEITKSPLSKELIANHLLGPSYISLESALSYYGLIPEKVLITRSVTLKRSKSYSTPLGVFEYISVPYKYFSIGVNMNIIEDTYAFLMAEPEKALCDVILTTPNMRIQSEKAMFLYLEENLRFDFSYSSSWNLEIIEQCIQAGKKKREFKLLQSILKNG